MTSSTCQPAHLGEKWTRKRVKIKGRNPTLKAWGLGEGRGEASQGNRGRFVLDFF